MPADYYRTIAATAEAKMKIERSDFLGVAFPCATEEDFFSSLQQIEKRHFDATHHCWAFRFFKDDRQRSSDAGEPSGTAGRPILSAIESADLFDVAIVVVRWFGGVKLGTGGLSRAYRDAAVEAIRAARSEDHFLYDRIEVEVPFDSVGVMYRLFDPPNIVLRSESFAEKNIFTVDVRRSLAPDFERVLTERRLSFTPR